MGLKTADICDKYAKDAQVAYPVFRHYGKKMSFEGEIVTLKVHEDNFLVRKTLETPGKNRVLVIDGGGSLRCALVGGNLAALAKENGWAGIILYGCVRDSEEISKTGIGIKALNTHPAKSVKKGAGDENIAVTFAGITFIPEHYVYADEDGIISLPSPAYP